MINTKYLSNWRRMFDLGGAGKGAASGCNVLSRNLQSIKDWLVCQNRPSGWILMMNDDDVRCFCNVVKCIIQWKCSFCGPDKGAYTCMHTYIYTVCIMALYTYINMCTYRHQNWKPLCPLCSWSSHRPWWRWIMKMLFHLWNLSHVLIKGIFQSFECYKLSF